MGVLRIALPNKGTLAEPTRLIIEEAGYLHGAGRQELFVQDPENGVEFFFLRPRDVATYVGEGILDLGVTGRDMLLDSGAAAQECAALGFGISTFRLAAPKEQIASLDQLDGVRIATSYPGVLRNWLDSRGIQARVVHLDGAVENAVALGVADVVADVVATGTTLRRVGLELLDDVILHSEAIVVARNSDDLRPDVATFLRRLHGVMVARTYVLVDYDIPQEYLEEACALTPGFESPTISPLRDPRWSAVRAMVPASRVHAVMDDLYALGARGILVTDIHACRL